jgi:hypothetical protein
MPSKAFEFCCKKQQNPQVSIFCFGASSKLTVAQKHVFGDLESLRDLHLLDGFLLLYFILCHFSLLSNFVDVFCESLNCTSLKPFGEKLSRE